MIKKEEYLAYSYLILTFTLWGSLYVVSKFILGRLPIFTISFFRFLTAFLFLAVLGRRKMQKLEKQDYKFVVVLGVIGYFLAVGTQLLGTHFVGASLASLLNSLNPISMYVFAVLFAQERLSFQKILSIFICIVGVLIIVGKGENLHIFGIVLSVLSVIIWSFVSVGMKRIMLKYPPIQITCYGVGIACVCYLPISIWEYKSGSEFLWSGNVLVLLLYMGAICTGLSYLMWNKSLSILNASTCSIFYPLQPVISTILSVLFLQESISWSFILGSLCIIMGVFINLYGMKGKKYVQIQEG
ncbi:EamA family transporter [Enterococcus hulanensis]|uniref:DMT family transporter n=1 Tax=Enterococcus hulanensis TaxID=2559929 RepID=UPI001A9089E3|nr:EamA family transporter [Enterococcus hulanensis]MBO0458115.1 EamA family transporter [Enterococcus hulanensis]